jgi:hypothetical protein
VERAGEGQRKRTRAATGLKATRGSCQSRRWHQQSCSDGERRWPATASSYWRLGSGVACSGEASGKEMRRWASSRAMRGGQERQGASGGTARRPAAALVGSRGGAEDEVRGGGGGARGLVVNFKNSRDLTVI